MAALRALDVFDHLPPQHLAVPVEHDALAPHLRAGEMAIVDPADTAPCAGELYAVRWAGGRIGLMAARPGRVDRDGAVHPAWWLAPTLSTPRSAGDALRLLEAGAGLSEGPVSADGFRRLVLGRVVGVAPFVLFAGEGGRT